MSDNSFDELANILSSGNVNNIDMTEDLQKIKVTINEKHDSSEVKTVKKTVEFVINNSMNAIQLLITLGQSTGNPRFFETAATMMTKILEANNQLSQIENKRFERNENKLPPSNGSMRVINDDSKETILVPSNEVFSKK